MRYAVCCKSCGNVESYAYETSEKGNGERPSKGERTTTPLSPGGHVPIYCQKCGHRSWQVPATEEQIAKFDESQRREVRATELCGSLNIEGLMKIPDEVRAAPEIKNAISNLLAPLDGAVLKAAQDNCVKVARSGVQVAADVWVDLYDRAVNKALKSAKDAKAAA